MRVQGKPHIYKSPDTQSFKWVCSNHHQFDPPEFTWMGFGMTPLEAYYNWRGGL